MVAVAGERCPCGRPFRLLAGIEGREATSSTCRRRPGGAVAIHPLALRTALAGIPGLAQYKVVQDTHGLHVRAALRPGAVPADTIHCSRPAWPAGSPPGRGRPAGRGGAARQPQDERDIGKFKLIQSRTPAAPVR